MKTSEVIEFFGGITKTARALGISHAAVSQWGDDVPKLRQYQIEALTNGALKRGSAGDVTAEHQQAVNQ